MTILRRPAVFRANHFSGFGAITSAFYLYLYAPIVALIVLSFNGSTSATIWKEFSLRWYAVALQNAGLRDAAQNSVVIALTSASLSTVLATMAALAIARRQRTRTTGTAERVIMLPLVLPEIVVGVATLGFFSAIGLSLGLGNLIIAHTVFCIPFAYLPIRARLQGMDNRYEQAAMDLYAREWATLRYVTLPLLMPAIVSGLMLAFVVSLDNFIISVLVAQAGSTTLPIFIFSLMRMGVTPDVNAASTIILAVSVALVVASHMIGKGSRKRS
ncbi:ABC transporter permease subunit [Paraburkholderia sp. 1N]|jgi:spermidine/putrescine transport system permease protein|uniref:Spermidine/putrescine transport system permease protein PotC n=1 Tax=Paraburkholderia solitsugae TaxID=2675748 RepID=A0ABX2BQT1_9BURK|nr:ABC transporter permease [Paraburkholderia solitsugae]NPT42496.1 ABC transporter permease subunit [Paraburkholderia solitsugae]